MNIYYYHPLHLSFTSAQTLQVIKDYVNLSRHGHRVFLYGTYPHAEAWREVCDEAAGGDLQLLAARHSTWRRAALKLRFLSLIQGDARPKLLITRTLGKGRELTRWRRFFEPCQLLTEMHEEAFPYLLGKKSSKTDFQRAMAAVDITLFTGPAQAALYREEFAALPARHLILPNGVELERFAQARRNPNGPVAYLGQFNSWKNVRLLFQALQRLPETLHLRIAGGKNDNASRAYIDGLSAEFGLRGRVDYRGYIPNPQVVERVLDGCSALLLPLGDNLQSRYLTSPMKLFEYMATAIPVVAVDFPSVRQLAGAETLYLAPAEPAAFAQAIRTAIDDPRAEQRVAAMNRAARQYSHDKRAEHYAAALREFCASA